MTNSPNITTGLACVFFGYENVLVNKRKIESTIPKTWGLKYHREWRERFTKIDHARKGQKVQANRLAAW